MEVPQLTVNDLLGPFGLVVGAILAVAYLTRELFKFIREYINNLLLTISQLRAQLSEALKLLRDQTDANRVLADAQAARNRDDEVRHRLEDVKGGGRPL